MKKLMFAMLFGIPMFIGTVSCSKEKNCVQTDVAETCICAEIYAPVCGCDGETYSNACVAECNGILTYTEGECN